MTASSVIVVVSALGASGGVTQADTSLASNSFSFQSPDTTVNENFLTVALRAGGDTTLFQMSSKSLNPLSPADAEAIHKWIASIPELHTPLPALDWSGYLGDSNQRVPKGDLVIPVMRFGPIEDSGVLVNGHKPLGYFLDPKLSLSEEQSKAIQISAKSALGLKIDAIQLLDTPSPAAVLFGREISSKQTRMVLIKAIDDQSQSNQGVKAFLENLSEILRK